MSRHCLAIVSLILISLIFIIFCFSPFKIYQYLNSTQYNNLSCVAYCRARSVIWRPKVCSIHGSPIFFEGSKSLLPICHFFFKVLNMVHEADSIGSQINSGYRKIESYKENFIVSDNEAFRYSSSMQSCMKASHISHWENLIIKCCLWGPHFVVVKVWSTLSTLLFSSLSITISSGSYFSWRFVEIKTILYVDFVVKMDSDK